MRCPSLPPFWGRSPQALTDHSRLPSDEEFALLLDTAGIPLYMVLNSGTKLVSLCYFLLFKRLCNKADFRELAGRSAVVGVRGLMRSNKVGGSNK